MSTSLGELSLFFSANTADLEASLRDIQKKALATAQSIEKAMGGIGKAGLKLTPKVDHSELYALNKHLDLKEKHFKNVQGYFDRNPLKPRVDDSELKKLGKKRTADVTVRVRYDDPGYSPSSSRSVSVRSGGGSTTGAASGEKPKPIDFKPLIGAIEEAAGDIISALDKGFKSNKKRLISQAFEGVMMGAAFSGGQALYEKGKEAIASKSQQAQQEKAAAQNISVKTEAVKARVKQQRPVTPKATTTSTEVDKEVEKLRQQMLQLNRKQVIEPLAQKMGVKGVRNYQGGKNALVEEILKRGKPQDIKQQLPYIDSSREEAAQVSQQATKTTAEQLKAQLKQTISQLNSSLKAVKGSGNQATVANLGNEVEKEYQSVISLLSQNLDADMKGVLESAKLQIARTRKAVMKESQRNISQQVGSRPQSQSQQQLLRRGRQPGQAPNYSGTYAVQQGISEGVRGVQESARFANELPQRIESAVNKAVQAFIPQAPKSPEDQAQEFVGILSELIAKDSGFKGEITTPKLVISDKEGTNGTYNPDTNELKLGKEKFQQLTKGLANPYKNRLDTLQAMSVLVHELRHAVQQDFGRRDVTQAPAIPLNTSSTGQAAANLYNIGNNGMFGSIQQKANNSVRVYNESIRNSPEYAEMTPERQQEAHKFVDANIRPRELDAYNYEALNTDKIFEQIFGIKSRDPHFTAVGNAYSAEVRADTAQVRMARLKRDPNNQQLKDELATNLKSARPFLRLAERDMELVKDVPELAAELQKGIDKAKAEIDTAFKQAVDMFGQEFLDNVLSDEEYKPPALPTQPPKPKPKTNDEILEEATRETTAQQRTGVSGAGVAFANLKGMLQNPLKGLSARSAKQLQANYQNLFKEVAKASDFDLDLARLPELKVDPQLLEQQSADALYDIEKNQIIISKELQEALKKSPSALGEYAEQFEGLVHEARHALQFDFGDLSMDDIGMGIRPGVKMTQFSATAKPAQQAAMQSLAYARNTSPQPLSKNYQKALLAVEADAAEFEKNTAEILENLLAGDVYENAFDNEGFKREREAFMGAIAELEKVFSEGIDRLVALLTQAGGTIGKAFANLMNPFKTATERNPGMAYATTGRYVRRGKPPRTVSNQPDNSIPDPWDDENIIYAKPVFGSTPSQTPRKDPRSFGTRVRVTMRKPIQQTMEQAERVAREAVEAFNSRLSNYAEGNYKEILAEVAGLNGIDFDTANAPELKVDDAAIKKAGTEAFYDVQKNQVIISRRIRDILQSNPEALEEYAKKLAPLVAAARKAVDVQVPDEQVGEFTQRTGEVFARIATRSKGKRSQLPSALKQMQGSMDATIDAMALGAQESEKLKRRAYLYLRSLQRAARTPEQMAEGTTSKRMQSLRGIPRRMQQSAGDSGKGESTGERVFNRVVPQEVRRRGEELRSKAVAAYQSRAELPQNLPQVADFISKKFKIPIELYAKLNIKGVTDVIQDLQKRLGGGLDKLQEKATALPYFGDMAAKAVGGLKLLNVAGVGTGITLLRFLGVAAKFTALAALAAQVALVTQQFDMLRTSFILTANQGNRSAEAFDRVMQSASNLRVDKATAGTGATEIFGNVAPKMGGQFAEKVNQAATESVAIYGNNPQQAQQIYSAFGQLTQQSTMNMGDFQQLMNTMPGSLDMMARSMGMTNAEFQNFIQNNSVLVEDFLPRFIQQLNIENAGRLPAAMDTLNAATNRYNNSLIDMQLSVGKVLAPLEKLRLNATAGVLETVGKKGAEIFAQWGTSMAFLSLAKLAISAKNVLAAIIPVAAKLPWVSAGLLAIRVAIVNVLPIIAKMMREFLIFQLAIDAVSVVWKTFNSAGGDFKNWADESIKGVNSLAESFDKAAKKAGELKKSLPTDEADLKQTGSRFEDTLVGAIIGKENTRFLESKLDKGLSFIPGYKTYAQKELYDKEEGVAQIRESGGIVSDKVLALKQGTDPTLKQFVEIEKKLEAIRMKRRALAATDPGDLTGLRELREQERGLLQEKDLKGEPIAKLQSEVAAKLKRYEDAIAKVDEEASKGAWTQEAYDRATQGLRTSLKEAEGEQKYLNSQIKDSATALMALQRQFKSLNAELADTNTQIAQVNNTVLGSISDASALGQITQGQSTFVRMAQEQDVLKQKILATRQTALEMKESLAASGGEEILANWKVDFNSTGAEQFGLLAERAQQQGNAKEEEVFNQYKRLKEMGFETSDLEAQLKQKKEDSRRQLEELSRSVTDYYRGIDRQSQELELQSQALSAEIGQTQFKSKIKGAIAQFEDNFISQFTDSLLSVVDELGKPDIDMMKAQEQMLQNQFQYEDSYRQGVDLKKQLPGQGANGLSQADMNIGLLPALQNENFTGQIQEANAAMQELQQTAAAVAATPVSSTVVESVVGTSADIQQKSGEVKNAVTAIQSDANQQAQSGAQNLAATIASSWQAGSGASESYWEMANRALNNMSMSVGVVGSDIGRMFDNGVASAASFFGLNEESIASVINSTNLWNAAIGVVAQSLGIPPQLANDFGTVYDEVVVPAINLTGKKIFGLQDPILKNTALIGLKEKAVKRLAGSFAFMIPLMGNIGKMFNFLIAKTKEWGANILEAVKAKMQAAADSPVGQAVGGAWDATKGWVGDRVNDVKGALKLSNTSGKVTEKYLTGLIPGQEYAASRDGGSRRHAGQDIDVSGNQQAQSFIGGIITKVVLNRDGAGYGSYVDVYNKALGVVERIAEVLDVNVKEGQTIAPGQAIGSGESHTGVFHYEIRKPDAQGRGGYGFDGSQDPIKFYEKLGIVRREGTQLKILAGLNAGQTLNTKEHHVGDGHNHFGEEDLKQINGRATGGIAKSMWAMQAQMDADAKKNPAAQKVAAGARDYTKLSKDENIQAIVNEAVKAGVRDKAQIAYIVATAMHETGGFSLVQEQGSRDYFRKYAPGTELGIDLGNTQAGDDYKFRGHGFTQLTGRRNFEKQSRRTGLDLVNNPSLLADPSVSANILVDGIMKGNFTGRKLSQYIGNGKVDISNARRTINGYDQDQVNKVNAEYNKIAPRIDKYIANAGKSTVASGGTTQTTTAVAAPQVQGLANIPSVEMPKISMADYESWMNDWDRSGGAMPSLDSRPTPTSAKPAQASPQTPKTAPFNPADYANKFSQQGAVALSDAQSQALERTQTLNKNILEQTKANGALQQVQGYQQLTNAITQAENSRQDTRARARQAEADYEKAKIELSDNEPAKQEALARLNIESDFYNKNKDLLQQERQLAASLNAAKTIIPLFEQELKTNPKLNADQRASFETGIEQYRKSMPVLEEALGKVRGVLKGSESLRDEQLAKLARDTQRQKEQRDRAESFASRERQIQTQEQEAQNIQQWQRNNPGDLSKGDPIKMMEKTKIDRATLDLDKFEVERVEALRKGDITQEQFNTSMKETRDRVKTTIAGITAETAKQIEDRLAKIEEMGITANSERVAAQGAINQQEVERIERFRKDNPFALPEGAKDPIALQRDQAIAQENSGFDKNVFDLRQKLRNKEIDQKTFNERMALEEKRHVGEIQKINEEAAAKQRDFEQAKAEQKLAIQRQEFESVKAIKSAEADLLSLQGYDARAKDIQNVLALQEQEIKNLEEIANLEKSLREKGIKGEEADKFRRELKESQTIRTQALQEQVAKEKRERENAVDSRMLDSSTGLLEAKASGLSGKGLNWGARELQREAAIMKQNRSFKDLTKDLEDFIKSQNIAADQAGVLRQQLQELGAVQMSNVQDQFSPWNDVLGSMTGGFKTFFSDVLSGSKSLKDAFTGLVDSILGSLANLAAEWLTNQIFGEIFGLGKQGGKSGGDFMVGSLNSQSQQPQNNIVPFTGGSGSSPMTPAFVSVVGGDLGGGFLGASQFGFGGGNKGSGFEFIDALSSGFGGLDSGNPLPVNMIKADTNIFSSLLNGFTGILGGGGNALGGIGSLISPILSIFGLADGGIVGVDGAKTPIANYAKGGTAGIAASMHEAIKKERALNGGRKAVPAVLTAGERVLNLEQTKRFEALGGTKILNFSSGGKVPGGSFAQSVAKAGSGGGSSVNVNVPVNIQGGNDSSIDERKFKQVLDAKVRQVIAEESRQGGSLRRR